MWRHLVVVLVLACFLSLSESFSLLSEISYGLIIPKTEPLIVDQVLVRVVEKNDIQDTVGPPELKEVRNVLRSVLRTLKVVVPDEFALPNISYPIAFKGALHMNQGRVTGIKSTDKPIIQSSMDKEGNMEFTVHLHFTNLIVTYDDLVLHFCWRLMLRRSKGRIRIFRNELVTKLRVVKTSEIFAKISSNQCILFLSSVKVTDLGNILADIRDKHNNRVPLTISIVHATLNSISQTLSEQITTVMAEFLWENFPESKGFLCRGKELREQIKFKSPSQNKMQSVNQKPSAPSMSNNEDDRTLSENRETDIKHFGPKPVIVVPEALPLSTERPVEKHKLEEKSSIWNKWRGKSKPKKDKDKTQNPVHSTDRKVPVFFDAKTSLEDQTG